MNPVDIGYALVLAAGTLWIFYEIGYSRGYRKAMRQFQAGADTPVTVYAEQAK